MHSLWLNFQDVINNKFRLSEFMNHEGQITICGISVHEPWRSLLVHEWKCISVVEALLLKYGFCKKLLRYKWTSDQLNTFFLTFWLVCCVSEVHLYRSNFLQNPYFYGLMDLRCLKFIYSEKATKILRNLHLFLTGTI